MNKLFPHCYRALLAQGYPPVAARQTLLAARRGDEVAMMFVRVAHLLNRARVSKMLALTMH
jgi:hypothetical protein